MLHGDRKHRLRLSVVFQKLFNMELRGELLMIILKKRTLLHHENNCNHMCDASTMCSWWGGCALFIWSPLVLASPAADPTFLPITSRQDHWSFHQKYWY